MGFIMSVADRGAVLFLAVFAAAAAHGQCAARFDSPPSFVHGNFLALADFDGDGQLDTLTAMPGEAAVRVNRGRGDGGFDRGTATPMRVALDAEPHLFAAAVADFDEDGHLDAAVASRTLGAVELLLGRGDGTFDVRTLAPSSYPRALAAADFDDDGHPDLAVADPDRHTVSIYWGAGNGLFSLPLAIDVERPIDVASGDLNGDGRDDLVIGRASAGLDVLLATSGRTFAAPQRLAVNRDHWGLVVQDYDGDAKLDIALADLSAFVVSTYRGNGDGTFQPRVDAPAGFATEGVAFGEFTGDERLDIVAGNGPDGKVVVLEGLSDGTFGAAIPYDAGGNVWGVRVADFNGDGRDDVLAADLAGYSVLLQNEEHTLPLREFIRAARVVYDTAVADFDGDGNPDLAAADLDDTGTAILFGRGDGTFGLFHFVQMCVSPISLASADFDGDAVPDLVAGCRFEVSVALGNGDGTFAPSRGYLPIDATRYSLVAPGDVDGDGDLDIAVVERATHEVAFLINDGQGQFTPAAKRVTTEPVPARALIADVNRDDVADLIYLMDRNDSRINGAGFLAVHLGRGDGTFGEARTIPAGTDPWEVRATDADGDGHADLVVSSWDDDGDVRVYRGDGTGAFTHAATLPAYGQALGFVTGDFNGDGTVDVALGNGRLVYVYHGAGKFAFRHPIAHLAGESPFTIDAADFDRDGWLDVVTTGFFGNVNLLGNEPVCRRRAVRP